MVGRQSSEGDGMDASINFGEFDKDRKLVVYEQDHPYRQIYITRQLMHVYIYIYMKVDFIHLIYVMYNAPGLGIYRRRG